MHESVQERVIGQLLIAFGQGTGAVSISDATVAALREHYSHVHSLVENWDFESHRWLERLRTIGRLAAFYATQSASVAIEPRMMLRAVREVEMVSAANLSQPTPFIASLAS